MPAGIDLLQGTASATGDGITSGRPDVQPEHLAGSTQQSRSGGKRIVFTGGSGKAGRHVIPYLQKQGHKVYYLSPPLTDSILNFHTGLEPGLGRFPGQGCWSLHSQGRPDAVWRSFQRVDHPLHTGWL